MCECPEAARSHAEYRGLEFLWLESELQTNAGYQQGDGFTTAFYTPHCSSIALASGTL